MWNLGTTAELWGQKPSSMLDIYNPWAAYQFDQVCATIIGVIRSRYYGRDNYDHDTHEYIQSVSDIVEWAHAIVNDQEPPAGVGPVSNYEKALAFGAHMSAQTGEQKLVRHRRKPAGRR